MNRRMGLTLVNERGSLVLAGLVSAAAVTLLALALFDLANVESHLVTDRESRTQAVYTAEAGLQDAWYQMAQGTPTFASVYGGTTSITSGSLSVQLDGNTSSVNYSVTRLSPNPTTNTPSTPNCDTVQCIRVQSTGYGPKTPLNPSGPSAVIQVVFSHNGPPGPPSFQYAAYAANGLTVAAGAFTDAYDPTVGCGTPPCPYSNSGSTKNSLSDGDIGSNGNINQSGGTISGDAVDHGMYTRTGGTLTGTVTNGAPTVTLPSVTSCYNPSATPPQLYSPASSVTLTGSSTYNATTGALSISSTVTLNRGTTYCFSTVTMTSGGQIQLSSTGSGPLIVYTTGRINILAGTVLNTSADPTQVQFLSSCTTCTGGSAMQMAAGGTSYITLYAPQSDWTVTGSGVLNGAVIGNNVTIRSMIHFDEALRGAGNLVGGIPTTEWKQDYWQLVSN